MKSISSLHLLGRVKTNNCDGARVGCCAVAELKLGRFPMSCPPHLAPEQHFEEMLANPLSPLGLMWRLSQPAPGCQWPSLFLLQCACGWEKSNLMEILFRKTVDLIFSLTQLGKLVEVQTILPKVLGMCDVQRGHCSCLAWPLQPQRGMPEGVAGL